MRCNKDYNFFLTLVQKMSWTNSVSPLFFKFFFCIIFFQALFINGCTSTLSPKNAEVSLVKQDDPVFDKRFENLSLKDIDLQNFWIDAESGEERKEILITSNTFAELVERVKDGVVNIYTQRLEMRETRFGIIQKDIPIKIPIISSLFEAIPFNVPIPYKKKAISLGSGFIINKQGYILTNAHVIHNSTDIRVVLSGGKSEFPAKIIGKDPLTDTALIKIDPDIELHPLPLGDSDITQNGEMVLAVGNPLGLSNSVSSGLISAKDRIVPIQKTQMLDFIQTDSAINPGSSGGPLLNLHGEVIGVNTAILTKAQLIGFAIPINIVKEVMPMLVLGKTERGWFGVSARPLTIKDAVDVGFSGNNGIIILEVEKNSPAETAGLQAKDIIVKINNWDVQNFLKFRRKLLSMAPGQNVHLTIFRNGKTLEISSQLINKPKK